MGKYSTFLFATPSFLEGVARTLDIGATFDSYNDSSTVAEADRRALYADWQAIDDDLREAMRRVLNEQKALHTSQQRLLARQQLARTHGA